MRAKEQKAEFGKGIKVIRRWHDPIGFTGVAILESDDPVAIANWILGWNEIIDIESTLVFDDQELRAIGKARNA